MRFRIIKCHGSGNDFPLIDGRELALGDDAWARIARALADRGGPVGGDGLLVLGAGGAGADFAMQMRNSDGSEAETCLNGLRCIARAGFAATGLRSAVVQLKTSRAQVALAAPLAPGVMTIEEVAGPADLDASGWVRGGGGRIVDTVIDGLPSARAFTAVKMPNPHLVAFVDAIDDAELAALGQFAEGAPPLLPERANVSFARVIEGGLFVRTRERGVGLTDSCGSAMAAATYAAALTGRIAWDAFVTVRNRGGMVQAHVDRTAMITIRGNATWEWEGHVEVDPATGRAGELEIVRRYPEEIAAWAAATKD